jgi:hypothetical protein
LGLKLLGAVALLLPRFPRLKEWAYAGTFIELTGASASWAARGGGVSDVVWPQTSQRLKTTAALQSGKRTEVSDGEVSPTGT